MREAERPLAVRRAIGAGEGRVFPSVRFQGSFPSLRLGERRIA
jgi:hypothetical protein